MEEAPENGKESSHSAHANGMNEWMNVSLWCLIQDVICIWNFSFLECSAYWQTPCVTVCTVPEICNRGVRSAGRGCAMPPAWLRYGHPRWARVSKDNLYKRLWGGCLCSLFSAAWTFQWWYSVIRVYKMTAVRKALICLSECIISKITGCSSLHFDTGAYIANCCSDFVIQGVPGGMCQILGGCSVF